MNELEKGNPWVEVALQVGPWQVEGRLGFITHLDEHLQIWKMLIWPFLTTALLEGHGIRPYFTDVEVTQNSDAWGCHSQ